jgi:hypothetical protein
MATTNPQVEDLELRENNPYSIGSIFSFDEGDFLLDREPINVQKSVRDQFHLVIEGETLSNIAGKVEYYNNSKYWWVIADVNQLYWSFELTPGMVLLIPDINQVKISS